MEHAQAKGEASGLSPLVREAVSRLAPPLVISG